MVGMVGVDGTDKKMKSDMCLINLYNSSTKIFIRFSTISSVISSVYSKCHVFHQIVDFKNPHHHFSECSSFQTLAFWRYTKDAAREVRLQRLHEAADEILHQLIW